MEDKMEEKKITREELAKEGLEAIRKIEQENQFENIIKDNKIEFQIDDKVYRVRKLTSLEEQELEKQRRIKYTALVLDNSYLFKKEWVAKYLEKGIDLDKKEKKIRANQYEIETLLLKLAKTSDPKNIDVLTESINKLKDEQFEISIEVTNLLQYCVESQLSNFVISYTTYVVLEVKDNENWNKVFKSYEEFDKSENNLLIGKALYFVNYLIYGENYSEKK